MAGDLARRIRMGRLDSRRSELSTGTISDFDRREKRCKLIWRQVTIVIIAKR